MVTGREGFRPGPGPGPVPPGRLHRRPAIRAWRGATALWTSHYPPRNRPGRPGRIRSDPADLSGAAQRPSTGQAEPGTFAAAARCSWRTPRSAARSRRRLACCRCSTVALLLVLAALFAWLNQRFLGLPSSIGLVAMGLLASLVLVGLEFALRSSTSTGRDGALRRIDFSATVIDRLLAFLLFAGALHLDLGALGPRRCRSPSWPAAACWYPPR